MSVDQRSPSDRPGATDRRVDRAGAMENAGATPCRYDRLGATRFPQLLERPNPPLTRSTRVLVVGCDPTNRRARPRSPGTIPTEVTG